MKPEHVDFHDERIDMSNWYPQLSELDVPTPETVHFELDHSGDGVPEWDTGKVAEMIVQNFDGEAFVRSGYKSAQMDMSASHIPNTNHEAIDHTLSELLSQHLMMQMPIGSGLYLREWLDLDYCHYARSNLVPEIRVFIRDGEVVCYHPRLEGFENHPEHREKAVGYIESAWDFDTSEEFTPAETPISTYAKRVAEEFDGCWSVDFVRSRSMEWYCTDMAVDAVYKRDGETYEVSDHPNNCSNSWL